MFVYRDQNLRQTSQKFMITSFLIKPDFYFWVEEVFKKGFNLTPTPPTAKSKKSETGSGDGMLLVKVFISLFLNSSMLKQYNVDM